jgi:hypothetical protein
MFSVSGHLVEECRDDGSENAISLGLHRMNFDGEWTHLCNGLMVPMVAFNQTCSFVRDALIKSIPKPEKVTAAQFGPGAEELFTRIMQLTDNADATDEHRTT